MNEKTKLEENMEDIFDLSSEVESMAEVLEQSKEIVKQDYDSDDDLIDDYQFARENLKNLINNANRALDDLSVIAQTSESPRAYEVLSTLMKTMVDANKDLLELQKKMKSLRNETNQPSSNVTNNSLFVGSTADLQKLIRDANVIDVTSEE